jgi:two-component system, OmpR family, response regulator CpxR
MVATLQRLRWPLACDLDFTFFILRIASAEIGLDNPEPAGGGWLMKPKRTILYVDDNEQSLSHRKIVLQTRGYRVSAFSRGEDALQHFSLGGIDLVIADLSMPRLDGPQLIAKIKEVSPQTPAILISSKLRVYEHDSQADVFLTKGMYAPADLLDRIRALLTRRRGPKRIQQRPAAETHGVVVA